MLSELCGYVKPTLQDYCYYDEMKNFHLVSERLKWAVQQKENAGAEKITQSKIASLFKPAISRTAVSNWFTEKNGMDAVSARVIAKFLGVNEIWLENGSGKPVEEVKREKRDHLHQLITTDPLDGMTKQLVDSFRVIPQADRDLLLAIANRLYQHSFPNDGVASGRKPKNKLKEEHK